ncbi:putative florfenicol exporter [Rostrohypoxylon terebratum]|nr:putative florfenicol exporter [Rostrohypoxylon terebratum]
MASDERKEHGGVLSEPMSETNAQLSAENREEMGEQADQLDAEAEKRLALLHELYGETWDGPDDPKDPYNWPEWRKFSIGIIFSVGQLVTLMSASVMAAALGNISHDLDIGASTAQITLSIYFMGLAIGPFVIAALGEMDGRKNVWVASNVWYILWNSLCPIVKSKVLMIVSRFLAATGAAVGVVLTGPVMADMYHAKDRGKSLAIASFLPYLGPALGPIIGGLVVQLVQWPWLFWILSIKESYTPVLLRRKAAAQLNQSGDSLSPAKWPFWRDAISRLATYLRRPARLLVRRLIIQVISLTLGLNFGIYTLMLSTFATLWIERYQQSSLISSLHYLSIAIGFCLASQVGGRIMDAIYKRLQNLPKYEGEGRPEFRASYMISGMILVPAGLFWYGWSAEYGITWIMVDIGAVIFCCGSSILAQSLLAYTLDLFGDVGASANAATRLLSNLMGFVFPIFAPQLYDRLGYGWGNSLLAFIFVALGIPVPMVLWFWGKRLRGMGKTQHDDN